MFDIFLPLYYIIGGFGVLTLAIFLAFYVVSKVAAIRQEKWLKAAVKQAIFESTPSWVNRRNIKRIK